MRIRTIPAGTLASKQKYIVPAVQVVTITTPRILAGSVFATSSPETESYSTSRIPESSFQAKESLVDLDLCDNLFTTEN